jgi:hypothetical protein
MVNRGGFVANRGALHGVLANLKTRHFSEKFFENSFNPTVAESGAAFIDMEFNF